MEIMICYNAPVIGRCVAQMIEDRVRKNPNLVLGLATGETMLPVYADIRRRCCVGTLSLCGVTIFTLDEYVLPISGSAGSFAKKMVGNLHGTDVDWTHVQMLDGSVSDYARECALYEQKINCAGGIDLQILGIGVNGHIAFNEPESPSDSKTRMVVLTDATREANKWSFGGDMDCVPTHALTMGIGTILNAREKEIMAIGQLPYVLPNFKTS